MYYIYHTITECKISIDGGTSGEWLGQQYLFRRRWRQYKRRYGQMAVMSGLVFRGVLRRCPWNMSAVASVTLSLRSPIGHPRRNHTHIWKYGTQNNTYISNTVNNVHSVSWRSHDQSTISGFVHIGLIVTEC